MDPVVAGVLVLAALVAVVVVLLVVARSRGPRTPHVDGVAVAERPDGLRTRLGKTRAVLSARLDALFRRSTLDADFWEGLEEALISADVGPATAGRAVAAVRDAGPSTGEEARRLLENELVAMLGGKDRELHLDEAPAVVLVVGVNGTGKTTSIAKLAYRLQEDGNSVVLGAADTFRAAADAQLQTWADRVGVDVVRGAEGADPASVAYDTVDEARAKGADVAIVDTAGRLHSKTNLMDELAKVGRVLEREIGISEVLLVIDGTTGQNGVAQATSFGETVGVTGLVLTKLDGTARGGVALSVEQELGVPVKFIGIGEGMEDLIPFDPRSYVEALLEP